MNNYYIRMWKDDYKTFARTEHIYVYIHIYIYIYTYIYIYIYIYSKKQNSEKKTEKHLTDDVVEAQ